MPNKKTFGHLLLQCDYSDQGTLKKINQSERHLRTKESNLFS